MNLAFKDGVGIDGPRALQEAVCLHIGDLRIDNNLVMPVVVSRRKTTLRWGLKSAAFTRVYNKMRGSRLCRVRLTIRVLSNIACFIIDDRL